MPDPITFDKATQPWTLPWDADWVTAVTFLGATRRIAAGNNLGQILLWDLPEKPDQPAPSPCRRLDGHSNVITRLLSTSDGRWLISASNDHTIRFWDMQAGGTGSATVSLNARTREDLIKRSSSKVPPAIEAKVETCQQSRTFDGHKEWVTAMALSADEKLIVSGDDGGHVIVWERETGKELGRWKTKGWVYALAVSPDAKQVLVSERRPLVFDSGRYDGVNLWDREKAVIERDLGPEFKGQYLAAAAFSPDGKLLAVARGGESDGNSGKVTLVDPVAGKKIRELTPGHLNGATDVAFHPDGVHLASCGRDTLVRVWHTAEGKLVKELGKSRGGQFKDWIHAVAFANDGEWLVAADMAGSVQVWNFPQ